MKSRIEDELRELFGRGAEEFDMDLSLPQRVVRRGRQRVLRATSALVAVAVAAAGVWVVTLRGDRGATAPLPHRASPSHAGATHRGTPALKLVDYTDPGGASPDTDGAGLQQYAQCMRDQGFDVPDPVQTEQGWSILVPPGAIDRSSPTWREAAFVTCRLDLFIGHPLTGDLVMTFPSQDGLQNFIACLHDQGFDLPAPSQSGDEYRFDLQGTDIDTSDGAWSRALFVTCGPPLDN